MSTRARGSTWLSQRRQFTSSGLAAQGGSEADAGHDPDQRNYTVSNQKIEKAGFSFAVTLDAGLAELVKGLPTLHAKRYSNF